MSKTIGGTLIFVAFVALLLFILALLALLDISIVKIGSGPHSAIFAFFNCGKDCIKTVMAISLVVFIPSCIVGGLLLKNKDGGDNTDNGDW